MAAKRLLMRTADDQSIHGCTVCSILLRFGLEFLATTELNSFASICARKFCQWYAFQVHAYRNEWANRVERAADRRDGEAIGEVEGPDKNVINKIHYYFSLSPCIVLGFSICFICVTQQSTRFVLVFECMCMCSGSQRKINLFFYRHTQCIIIFFKFSFPHNLRCMELLRSKWSTKTLQKRWWNEIIYMNEIIFGRWPMAWTASRSCTTTKHHTKTTKYA